VGEYYYRIHVPVLARPPSALQKVWQWLKGGSSSARIQSEYEALPGQDEAGEAEGEPRDGDEDDGHKNSSFVTM